MSTPALGSRTRASEQPGTRSAEHPADRDKPHPADVLVIFGITGDLAKVMTFHSLYRLEARGLLDCPIVGRGGRGLERGGPARARARGDRAAAVRQAGETFDEQVFARFAARLSYVSGDFADAGTYEHVAKAIGEASTARSSIWRSPLRCSAWSSRASRKPASRQRRGSSSRSRSATTSPPRARSHEEIHQYIDESQLYRIDHFLGKMGTDELLYLRFGNTMIEPIWNRNHIACVQITMAESFGVEDRGHFYDPVGALRDVVVNHLMQLVGGRGDGGALPATTPRR